MHFVDMLAFDLPIELGYDPAITLLSLAMAIASSAFALWFAGGADLDFRSEADAARSPVLTQCQEVGSPPR